MLQVRNDTPFVVVLLLFPDEQGIETVYVTVKATFDMRPGGLEVAAVQRPLFVMDEYWGSPEHSSLKYASEAHLMRPGTDVVVIGEAHAPRGCPTDSCPVSVQVGSMRKTLIVSGDRIWRGGTVSPRISPPEPFLKLPLVYERAFGGKHETRAGNWVYEPRNPVGTGFRGKRSASEMLEMRLPNLEDPAERITSITDSPAPVGFGYTASSWDPRRTFAGTYDQAWQTHRAPYLPLDFKPAFFEAASPGLHSPRPLTGGEPVELVNLSPSGAARFRLPRCELRAAVRVASSEEHPPLLLDRVLIEPGASRLCMLWRGAVPCDKRVLKVREAHVHMHSLELGGPA